MNDDDRRTDREVAYMAALEKLVELLEAMPGAARVTKTKDQEKYARALINTIKSQDPGVLTFRKPRLKVHAFLESHHAADAAPAMERINRLFG